VQREIKTLARLSKKMILEKAEGVVLRSFPFRERQRILTLFTHERGLISLIMNNLSKKDMHLLGLTHLFCRGEFLYVKGNSDLYRFSDGTLLDHHLFLRQDWRYLDTVSKCAHLLLKSQLPGKPAPHLYELFIAYLRQLPYFPEPSPLLASFYVKLLHHEGVLKNTEDFQPLLLTRSFKELKTMNIDPHMLREIEALVQMEFGHWKKPTSSNT
jgi:DNA repair protein RecO